MCEKPVRKIKNSIIKKNIGYFPSNKNKRSIAFESLLERDYMYLLEFDENVISYLEQPVTIEFNYLNRNRTYTPDVKIIKNNKIEIVEIKPFDKVTSILANENKKIKFIAANNYCKQNGYEFKIITDKDIYTGCILKNIKYIFMYSTVYVPSYEKLNIKNELARGNLNIETLLLRLNQNNINKSYKAYIFKLIYDGVIKISLNEPITNKSLISM